MEKVKREKGRESEGERERTGLEGAVSVGYTPKNRNHSVLLIRR